MSNTRATIITIGDELLIGQTIDTNSAFIAQQLNPLGIDVVRRVAVGDTREAILGTLHEEINRNEILILTGGLGPTSDDITKPLLSEFFGGKMVVNEAVLTHVKDIFSRRKRPFLAQNMKQAEVPDSCKVLFNRMGTAPGMWFEQGKTIVISLPGVPFEMMTIMQEEAIPRIQERFISDAIVHHTIVTAGEGESFIAEQIKDLEAALPLSIKLAYLPQPNMVKLRLTGHAKDQVALQKEVKEHATAISSRITKYVMAQEDLPLEEILGRLLNEMNLTIGLAESCTGGYIGHRITNIPGASDYFMGSLVCYRESAKENVLGVDERTLAEFGVISEEVAIEMAAGAQKALNTTIGFGITGMLGPTGNDRVKAGTVCMAAVGNDRTFSKTFQFYYDRLRNKEIAVNNALLFIWRFIQDKSWN